MKKQKVREKNAENVPILPNTATQSAKAYFKTAMYVFNLYAFVLRSEQGMREMAPLALEILSMDVGEDSEQYNKKLKEYEYERKAFWRDHANTFLEMFFTRFVDNFLNYLSEIIREALKAKPEIIRSKDQITVEYVLSYKSFDELLADLVDRKVNELSYCGYSDLEKWLNDRMGIIIVNDENDKLKLIEILETRNIIVHNRAVVNKKYLRNVTNTTLKEGNLRKIEVQYFSDTVRFLHDCVAVIDNVIAQKFSLKRELVGQKLD